MIFLSGTGTVETATRAMRMGAFDFLEKPVDGQRLVARVWKAAQARETIAHLTHIRGGATDINHQRIFQP